MESATKQDITQLKSDIAEMFKDQTKSLLGELDGVRGELREFREQNTREHEAIKGVTDAHELRIQALEQKSVA